MRWSLKPALLLLQVPALVRGHPVLSAQGTEARKSTGAAASAQIILYPNRQTQPRVPPLTFNLTISPLPSLSSPDQDSSCSSPPCVTINDHLLGLPNSNSVSPLRIAAPRYADENENNAAAEHIYARVKWHPTCDRRTGSASSSSTTAQQIQTQKHNLDQEQQTWQQRQKQQQQQQQQESPPPAPFHCQLHVEIYPLQAIVVVDEATDTETNNGTVKFVVYYFRTTTEQEGHGVRIQIVGLDGLEGATASFTDRYGNRHDAAVGGESTGEIQEGEEVGDLKRELAELEEMRGRLRELEREVEGRERWLIAVGGFEEVQGEEDGMWRMIGRKVKHAVEAVFGGGDGDGEKGGQHHGNMTVPLPPWHRPGYNGTDTYPHTEQGTTDGSLLEALNHPFAKLIPLFALFALLLRLVAVYVLGSNKAAVPPYRLPVYEAEGRERGCAWHRWQHGHRWWSRFWPRVRLVGGKWGRRGEIRLGDMDGGEHTYHDEKREFRHEDVGLLEEGSEVHGEFEEQESVLEERESELEGQDEQEGAEYRSEHQDEDEAESEGDIQSEDRNETDDEELLSLDGEFASFRAALDLIDDIVAAGSRR